MTPASPNRCEEPAAGFAVKVVRTLEDLAQVYAVRALVFMGDQACPHREEFDGNDICGATHLLLTYHNEPAGAVRMRWFGEFAKMERLAVRREYRGGPGLLILCRAAFELAARKGFRKLLGHAQVRGRSFWKRYFQGRPVPGRPTFEISRYECVELEFDLRAPPDVIRADTPPFVVLRPEGDWDHPGVLEVGILEDPQRGLAA